MVTSKQDSKVISKDEQWLKDLAAQNSFYAQQSGVQQALAEESKSADEQLQEETLAPPPPPKSKVDMRVADREAAKLDKLHKRAEKLDAADREHTAKEEEARVEAEFKAQQ